MTITKIISRTIFLAFMGITIVVFLCVNEILNGTGLTHPIWDKTYNWLPLFRDILYISFVGALLSEGARNSSDYGRTKKIAIKEKRIPTWSVELRTLKRNYKL
jgi:hypothetical protein